MIGREGEENEELSGIVESYPNYKHNEFFESRSLLRSENEKHNALGQL